MGNLCGVNIGIWPSKLRGFEGLKVFTTEEVASFFSQSRVFGSRSPPFDDFAEVKNQRKKKSFGFKSQLPCSWEVSFHIERQTSTSFAGPKLDFFFFYSSRAQIQHPFSLPLFNIRPPFLVKLTWLWGSAVCRLQRKLHSSKKKNEIKNRTKTCEENREEHSFFCFCLNLCWYTYSSISSNGAWETLKNGTWVLPAGHHFRCFRLNTRHPLRDNMSLRAMRILRGGF